MKKLKAVDFFCGGGGMSYGMKLAGIEILAGIDYEEKCRDTYDANIGEGKFLNENVFNLKVKHLENRLNLKKDDNELILIGCSPCQFWSIINTTREKSNESKNLLVEFKRFVRYFKPGYVVVENVPGVYRRQAESGLEDFIKWLKKNRYKVHFDNHNISDYGVPQSRKRFTLIANRVSKEIIEPVKCDQKKVTVRDIIGVHNGFPKVEAGNKDQTDFMHTVAGLADINIRRLQKTKHNGGLRTSYANDEDLAPPCHQNDNINFKDTYGRMHWDQPAPTITTKFFSISNGRFAHPEEDRAISLREGASLQSFPKEYVFKTSSISDTARMIGNAVPPEYAKRIGIALVTNQEQHGKSQQTK